MDFYELGSYQSLAGVLDEQRGLKANLLVVSVPGSGVSFHSKKYLEKEGAGRVAYITGPGEQTLGYSILDLDFDMNPEALEWADQYFKVAGTEDKFAVVVNTPNIINSEMFKQSYVGRHVYKTCYFVCGGREIVEQMSEWLGLKLESDAVERIDKLTGGVGRWVKYFLGHLEKVNVAVEQLLEDEEMARIVGPTAVVVKKCDLGILEKLGIVKEGKVRSLLLQEWLEKKGGSGDVDLKVETDLTVVEDGKTGEKLLKVEAEMVRYMLEHEYVVEKEKVADMKWGEGTYDKFSDQAINKSVRRLDKKLKIYKIETISGYGFKLVRR